jgi:hypothetical protein
MLLGSDNYSTSQLRSFADVHKDPHRQSQLLFRAASIGDEGAAYDLLTRSANVKNQYWLRQLTQIDSSEAAYELAVLANSPREQRQWFRFAAKRGHAKSQFELSLLVKPGDEQYQLLESAALQNYTPALITMAKYYHQNLRFTGIDATAHLQHAASALKWLRLAADFDETSAFKLAKLHWHLNNKDEALTFFAQSEQMGNPIASDYLNVIEQFTVIEPEQLFTKLVSNPNQSPPSSSLFNIAMLDNNTGDTASNQKSAPTLKSCSQNIQFIASTLDSVVQASLFKQRFDADLRFDSLPICIQPVAWLPTKALQCSTVDEQRSGGRVKCDLSRLATILQEPDFSHLVVFADSGRAYVQRGVMYLDRADEYSVFIHELAHFAGFVDEYALSSGLAQQHCSSSSAPNLMITDSAEGFDHVKLKKWRALDERTREIYQASDFSIATSKTCKNAETSSFKPSADITFLEHHDTEYIPQLYLALWQQELQKRHAYKAVTEEFLHYASRLENATVIEHWQRYQAPFLPRRPRAAALSTSP